MLPARRNKWLAVLLVLLCHELVIAQDGGTDEHSADTSQQTQSQRILAAFPESAQVDLQLPEPIRAIDAEYFAWISGTETKSSGIVSNWAATMGAIDAEWCSELFQQLQKPASDYVALLEVTKNFGERASQLKGLVISRDRLVEELFARERRALETLLSASNVEEPEAEAVVEQVMMVRRAEACAPDTTYSPHLVANILRLLHLAATDRSTSPEASASIRRLALDHAPSMCEQRRVVFEAMKKCGYRGNEALQRAIDSGNSTTGSMASVFRPIALGSARVAATTQDIAAMARAELTPEVAKKLDDSLLRLTYGALAFDIFSTDAVAHVLIPLVPDQDRETCVAPVLDSARQRAVLRERMLKSFDMERSKFIERGLVRDEAASDRFGKSLLGYLKTARIGA